jgi:hypothetical protein
MDELLCDRAKPLQHRMPYSIRPFSIAAVVRDRSEPPGSSSDIDSPKQLAGRNVVKTCIDWL